MLGRCWSDKRPICLLKIVKKNWRLTIVYLFCGILIAFLSNFKAVYYEKIIDGLTVQTLALSAIFSYGGILCTDFLINYLDEYPGKKLAYGIYLDCKLLALEKISRISYLEYQKLGTGKLVQRIENGAEAGRGILFYFWFELLRNLLPRILFGMYFIWKTSKPVTYMLLAGYVVVFLTTNLLLKLLYQMKERILTNEELLNHYLVRGFMEMLVFRLHRQFPSEIRKAEKAKNAIVDSKVKMNMIHEAFFTIFALLVALLNLGILLYAWRFGTLSVGQVVALLLLVENAYTPIAIFNVLYVQYKLDKSTWFRFWEFLDATDDEQLTNGKQIIGDLREIRVEKLSFYYDNRKVLHEINLTIRESEKIAFVGESGSGKSTLVKLIAGLLKYEEGIITIDGVPLKEICLESLYEKISYLPQDAAVFNGTVGENLAFDHEVSLEQLEESLREVQLFATVKSLKYGVDTRIGERGSQISGGEKQRLALARLWFEDPKLILLDEATSALDNLTEACIMETVRKRFQSASVIAVAHRLASVKDFDRILVFQDGRIVGDGTFQQLLSENEYFALLVSKEQKLQDSCTIRK